jgi:replicative DNA helicase
MQLQDVAAERATLSGLYRHGVDAWADVSDILSPQTFTVLTNEIIFKAFQYLFDVKNLRTIDKSSLFSAVNELGFSYIWQNPDDIAQVKAIVETPIALENVRVWAVKIKKLDVARGLREAHIQSIKDIDSISGDESVDEIISTAEKRILTFAMAQNNDEETIHIAHNLDEYIEYIRTHKVEQVGISTGYPLFDMAIGGALRRKTINTIIARTKAGKSTLGGCIGLYVSGRLQIKTLILDTEMDKETQISRIIPNIIYRLNEGNNVSITEFETGRFIDDKEKDNAVLDAADRLKKTKLFYRNIAGKDFDEIISIIRRFIYKEVGFTDGRTNDCLIIYDWLKISNPKDITNSVSEYQRMGFIITALHDIAEKYDVPMLCFGQSNRGGINDEDGSVVGVSDRISWFSSSISLYREKTEEETAENPDAGNRKLIPLYVRHGEGLKPGDYINFGFHKKFGYIEELDTRFNLEQQKKSQNKSMVEMDGGDSINV